MVEKFDQLKLSVLDHNVYKSEVLETSNHLSRKIDDIYNRMVANDVYLDKYLPYNTFV